MRGPLDLVAYLGPEMADLAQEQLRVVLLDTKNHVLGTSLVYQGGLNATVVRLADFFREAVRGERPRSSWCTTIPPATRRRRPRTFG